MHVLGDYDQLGSFSAQAGFKGDHSSGVHLRENQPKDTCCFHDPLRSKPIDLPLSRLRLYSQKPGAVIRGLAGWVQIKEEPVRTYTITGASGSIDIIPNPKNKYLLCSDDSLHSYTFTHKDNAVPCTIKPALGPHTSGFLVPDDMAFIPAANATFTPNPGADCSAQDAALAQIHTLSA
jgi:hypothetical protein